MPISIPYEKPTEVELLPNGSKWAVEIKSCEEGFSSKGNEMLVCKVQAYDETGPRGRAMTEYLVDTERARFKFNQVAQATGLANQEGVAVEYTPESLTGLKATVIVKEETYTNSNGDDRTTNRIAEWLEKAE